MPVFEEPFPLRILGLNERGGSTQEETVGRSVRGIIDRAIPFFTGMTDTPDRRLAFVRTVTSHVSETFGDQVAIGWQYTDVGTIYARVTITSTPIVVGGDLSSLQQNQQSASYQPINLSIEETYGFGILNEGQAIGVARNIRIRPNESLRPNPIYTLGDPDPNNYRRELKDPLKYGALPIKNSSCVLTWEVEIDGVIRTLSKELDLRRDVYFNRDVDRNIQDKIVIEASIPVGILQDSKPVKEEVFVLENRLETALKFMTDED